MMNGFQAYLKSHLRVVGVTIKLKWSDFFNITVGLNLLNLLSCEAQVVHYDLRVWHVGMKGSKESLALNEVVAGESCHCHQFADHVVSTAAVQTETVSC